MARGRNLERALNLLIAEHNIHFDHKVGPHKWPAEHREIFAAIKTLGRIDYEQYYASTTIESQERPWRDQTKRRAERIAVLAQRCLNSRQNEAGWRLELESLILERFSTEVTCRKCSARLWRSEVEVTLNSLDTFAESLNLPDRQRHRTACTCSEIDRGEDPWEPNLSHIFHNRPDELIAYREEDSLHQALPKGDRPDRVFGLRKTKRFEQLLDRKEDQRPEYKGELLSNTLECGLECGPFREVQDPVLFPFLVLEAKSEEGAGFNHIETQTAFAILKLLNIQLRLKEANGKDSQWGTGPLVWFLSYRGDQWRVAAAYVQSERGIPHYRVVDLWDGRISYPEGALRLLLIIDYIFDWGRDKYREAVLCELRTLAARNVSSLADDSEVLSLADPFHRWWNSPLEEIPVEFGCYAQDMSPKLFDKFRPYDSVHGVIRSASTVCTRFLGLYITKENIDDLLSTFDTTAKAQRIARDLLRLFKDAWIVTSYALDELEYIWSGHRRENTDLYEAGGDKFCAVFTITAYFSPQWEQILELSFVAIAEDAFSDLKNRADLHRGGSIFFSEMPVVGQDHLTGAFRFARQGSIRSNIQAAATRSCMSSRIARENDHPDAYFLVAEEKYDKGVRYRMDVAMLPDSDAKGREMVVWFYNRYKIGNREPQESFLRFSGTYEDRTLDSESASLWPTNENHIEIGAKALLLRAKSSYNYQRPPNLCLYLLDKVDNPTILLQEFASPTKPLTVRRQDIRPGWGPYWNDEFAREADPIFNAEFQNFQAHCSALPNIQTDSADAGEPKPQYHSSNELPTHCKTKPMGHWTIFADGPNTFEQVRLLVDSLVARKRNVKLITCLYANPKDMSTKGLRAENSIESNPVYSTSKERRKKLRERFKNGQVPEFEIKNICQAGDSILLPSSPRLRGVPANNSELVGCAGDWLSDEELNAWLNNGGLGGSKTTQTSKRARADSDSEPERTPKRALLETGTSKAADGDSIEHSQMAGHFAPGEFLQDHMADDELEAFLRTGYFTEETRKDWKRLNRYTEDS